MPSRGVPGLEPRIDVDDLEIHRAEHAVLAEAEVAEAVVEVDPDRSAVPLIGIAAQEEQLAAERARVDAARGRRS